MPIALPKIDDRRYEDLFAEALAKIPTATPEWTNFNQSDPGVTLIGLFAFLTECLLFRANQIPERNLKKFLQLLRIPLRSATAARGLVTIANEVPSANPAPVVLGAGLELRAGKVPFRTERALDVLPAEGRLYVKRRIAQPSAEMTGYYRQLYASYRGATPEFPLELYEAVPFPAPDGAPLALAATIDQSVWLALLVRQADAAAGVTAQRLRKALEHRTLTLGVAPSPAAAEATLPAGRPFGSRSSLRFEAFAPKVGADGGLPTDGAPRLPEYRPLESRSEVDVFTVVGTVDISLPGAEAMQLWNNLDPLEAGIGALPPQIDDEEVAARVATWVRLVPSAATSATFQWLGINAVTVTQRARVVGELLAPGTGEPDQVVRLALAPALADSVEIAVAPPHQSAAIWTRIDDLATAPPEVPRTDPARAGATRVARREPSPLVFVLDAEAGEVRFGDGLRGARVPEGAVVRATYDHAVGAAGNVGSGAIDTSPALPAGFRVANPLPTTGGANAETVAEGEKQISRYVQHRNRLVTVSDFVALTLRTPGIDVARVEVMPNYHPARGTEAPGVVTLMLVPAVDPEQPDAPLPRTAFLEAVCRHLDPWRLVTTELQLRGPDYQGIWISIGVKVDAGFNESQVTEAVKQDIVRFLAPFSSGGREQLPDADAVVLGSAPPKVNGWKLGKAVVPLELVAVANRTPGVEYARDDVILARSDGTVQARVELAGLQLPRILGIRVSNGPAVPLSELMGGTGAGPTGGSSGNGSSGNGSGGGSTGGEGDPRPRPVQVPVIPEECNC